MEFGCTLRIQKETSESTVSGFSEMKVQPFFRSKSFYAVNHKEMKKWIDKYNVKILSLHFPSIEDNLIDNLKMLSEIYQQKLFTVHPSASSPEEFLKNISGIEKEVTGLGIELAFENMPFHWRWNSNPEKIYKIIKGFQFSYLTYDTTHLPKRIDTVECLEKVFDKTKIIHLSNVYYGMFKTDDHQPIDNGDRKLDKFLKHLHSKSFDGQVILEYRIHDPAFLKQEIEKACKISRERIIL
jgi:sugar phosphate isomerase/epimerase